MVPMTRKSVKDHLKPEKNAHMHARTSGLVHECHAGLHLEATRMIQHLAQDATSLKMCHCVIAIVKLLMNVMRKRSMDFAFICTRRILKVNAEESFSPNLAVNYIFPNC